MALPALPLQEARILESVTIIMDRKLILMALRNIQNFYDAFDIKEGDPMFMPEDQRVVIW